MNSKKIDMATIIRGSKALAKVLGVHYNTVLRWRMEGMLTPATLADCGKTIIYDLEKVFECLKPYPIQPRSKWKPPYARGGK